MNKKSSLSSISDESNSSPEESNFYYLNSSHQQQYVRNFISTEQRNGTNSNTEKTTWKHYFTNSDLMTSAIFTQIESSEESNMANQVSFLYDYYGMTEETRQDPPSPGHSSPMSNVDEKERVGIDIPSREGNDSPILEISHSFPESGRPSLLTDINPGDEYVGLTKKPHSASVPSINKERSSSYSSQACSPTNTSHHVQNVRSLHSQFPKGVFGANEKYVFILGAQTSIVQKRGEDTLTYLNKGQFYNLTFEAKSQSSKLKTVKSVIHLVFRDEKDPASELAHWKYWYNQQPNPNQRAFDIDRKSCQNIDDIIEEVGCNALGFTWDPSEQAKVSLRINCLSTDFSPQKGVRGIPLHIQIDSFEDMGPHAQPVHRAFCQIKVFRDKGAERKNKDESKSVSKRMFKYLRQGSESNQVDMANVFQLGNKVTVLHPASPLGPKSVIFVPNENGVITSNNTTTRTPPPSSSPGTSGANFFNQIKERESKRGFNTALSNTKENFENLDVYPKFKLPRVVRRKEPAVTIYVRKEEEKAYNALMLETFTLNALKAGLSKKYNIPEDMIKSVFKKTKKGILVNMDDQLVEQFVDEDDFLVTIEFDNQLGNFEVYLSC